MIHIGKLIEAEFRRQERTVSWFARNLYCERTNIYDIFKRRSIDTEMLLRISLVLRHNFFLYYLSELESEGGSSGCRSFP
ncbi:MAG: XRE family transcriptional regulator [Alistipes sp.]|nr:XRE family transcriptional regulator [Alistipes senegalensis]MCM1250055.1 XRE family transcriptional regulator [Alistipes sp.]